MPEGDTVWRAAKRLNQALAGQELVRTDFRVPTLATTDLSGRTVLEVVARGKHLLTRLSGGLTIHTHFRLEGSWHLYRAGERWRGGPDFQVRVVLETANWTAVGYRLPVLELVATDAEDDVVGHLGPDLLSPDFDRSTAIANLAAEPSRTISEALLDQRNLAGIGNFYRIEVCFLLGLHPWRPVSSVDLGAAVDLSRRLMKANLRNGTQVSTGVDRPGRRTWVFERAGKPCRRCATTIQTAPIGEPPRERVTHWCPVCQPAL
ncbi:Fpg/Nei family DNA glycosylase [Kribbella qitaiheensis]|uniref:DNA-(apurinic or apyrimidinic site) lyase n=1 Tax=Kribbella qitaiheensis TaxID=1544730 RepID=A0A7G6X7L4_9ACTN|nr:Fpg/Nei family DNA glycosylase [Kribbella qitaiheensis]QNE22229.1 Fpg/Nei family DNA glycosylase [Kribbella qitaiheensis]